MIDEQKPESGVSSPATATSGSKPGTIRTWLQRNEPRLQRWLTTKKIYFETIAATALAVAGAIFSFGTLKTSNRQAELAGQQNQLAEKQLAVAEQEEELHKKEAALVELQTDIARTQILPRFTFQQQDDGVLLTNEGMHARGLSGRCTAYLALDGRGYNSSRIELASFFAPFSVPLHITENDRMTFHYPATSTQLSSLRDQFVRRFNQPPPAPPPNNEADLVRWSTPRLRLYVELKYYDPTGAICNDRFTMNWDCISVEPLKAPLSMDAVVSLEDCWLGPHLLENQIDIAKVTERVLKLQQTIMR